jgi:hypothetical protein
METNLIMFLAMMDSLVLTMTPVKQEFALEFKSSVITLMHVTMLASVRNLLVNALEPTNPTTPHVTISILAVKRVGVR